MASAINVIIALAVNGLLLAACIKVASAFTPLPGWRRMMDAMLLDYLIQYGLVCGLGLCGILSFYTLYGAGLILSIVILWKIPLQPVQTIDRSTAPGGWMLCGYFIPMIGTILISSLVGDDALMYHLPIPAIWLSHHNLQFFTTWFSNPANSYSPLAVETFMTWLMAPTHNDSLVHCVQIPAILLIYFAGVELLISAGVDAFVASVVVIAAVLSRPLITQTIYVKDDIFVAAFFLVALAGLSNERMRDRFAPWRIGIAMGLFLATKYTALQTLPLILLVIDAPFRARWNRRQWGIAIGLIILIAGPWYLRNILITGNPLYPVPLQIAGVQIFKGLFFPLPSTVLHSLNGIWSTFTESTQGLSSKVMALALLGWGVALIAKWKRLGDPATRVVLLGFPLGMLVFIFVSHAPEVRYAYATILLMIFSAAFAIELIPPLARIPIAIIFALTIASEGFPLALFTFTFIFAGVVLAAIAWAVRSFASQKIQIGIACAVAVVVVFMTLNQWTSIERDAEVRALDDLTIFYPEIGPLWKAAAVQTASNVPIAYANLAMIRPLMGFDYSRDVFYIPTRAGVKQCSDLPASNVRLNEPDFRAYIEGLLAANPDREAWWKSLNASGAGCIVIGQTPYAPYPPELEFARNDPQHFHLIAQNSAGCVFEIAR